MVDKIDIRQRALECLLLTNPWEKASATQSLYQAAQTQSVVIAQKNIEVPFIPGRPLKPELVNPRDLPRRRNNEKTGHASLIHAITHIEFNAINLGLDAVARFKDMPAEYYLDWLQVAYEEANHFEMLDGYLKEIGFSYGDFTAHDGLWEMAQKTAHDPLIRMALVPRVLEARGLDVTPGMMDKLSSSGNHKAVDILKVILREEIGHVAIGTKWFNYLCELRDLDSLETFRKLLKQYFTGEIRGPLHNRARVQAGFTEAEMAWLEAECEKAKKAITA